LEILLNGQRIVGKALTKMRQPMVVLGLMGTVFCVFYAGALGVMTLRIYESLFEMELIQHTIALAAAVFVLPEISTD
jgi:hypothetical protein